jgi:hypothetical protein
VPAGEPAWVDRDLELHYIARLCIPGVLNSMLSLLAKTLGVCYWNFRQYPARLVWRQRDVEDHLFSEVVCVIKCFASSCPMFAELS